jgi:outer membrane protein TolC
VVDALSALERAYAVREAARENLRLATEVEQGERRTFQEGKSDLFRVNIRELQRAEAQYREVDALSEFYRALADYNAALGNDLSLATREK